MTGEVGIGGAVRPVGGIPEKLYAALAAGMRVAIVPHENEHDVPRDLRGMDVTLVSDVREALAALGVEQPANQ